jgi:hypothetical protein
MSTSRTTEGAVGGLIAKLVRVKPGTTPTEVGLTGTNWRASFDPKLRDISNWRDGRRKAMTLPDGTITCDVVWDPDDPPTDEANMGMRMGVAMTIRCYTSDTDYFQVPVKVGVIGPAIDLDGGVIIMAVTLAVNGEITYPGDTATGTIV